MILKPDSNPISHIILFFKMFCGNYFEKWYFHAFKKIIYYYYYLEFKKKVIKFEFIRLKMYSSEH